MLYQLIRCSYLAGALVSLFFLSFLIFGVVDRDILKELSLFSCLFFCVTFIGPFASIAYMVGFLGSLGSTWRERLASVKMLEGQYLLKDTLNLGEPMFSELLSRVNQLYAEVLKLKEDLDVLSSGHHKSFVEKEMKDNINPRRKNLFKEMKISTYECKVLKRIFGIQGSGEVMERLWEINEVMNSIRNTQFEYLENPSQVNIKDILANFYR